MIKLQRLILTATPVAFIVRKSKHWYLPGFEGVPLFDVVQYFFKQVKTVGLTERASAIAYNFIMAIPPSFIFKSAFGSGLPIGKGVSIAKAITSAAEITRSGIDIFFIQQSLFKDKKE